MRKLTNLLTILFLLSGCGQGLEGLDGIGFARDNPGQGNGRGRAEEAAATCEEAVVTVSRSEYLSDPPKTVDQSYRDSLGVINMIIPRTEVTLAMVDASRQYDACSLRVTFAGVERVVLSYAGERPAIFQNDEGGQRWDEYTTDEMTEIYQTDSDWQR